MKPIPVGFKVSFEWAKQLLYNAVTSEHTDSPLLDLLPRINKLDWANMRIAHAFEHQIMFRSYKHEKVMEFSLSAMDDDVLKFLQLYDEYLWAVFDPINEEVTYLGYCMETNVLGLGMTYSSKGMWRTQ